MDNSDRITPLPEERGAGGKLRKPPPRKPPSTPYARPSTTTNRRWISKLVDPAYRIIAGGATRFLPSFFSTSDSSSTEDQTATGKRGTGEQHNEDNLLESNLHLPRSELSKMASTGDDSSKLNNSFDFVLLSHVENREQHENNTFSDIERLVKGKKFTRDEFNHIVEVLNSRAIDVSNVEQGKEHTNLTSRQDVGGLVAADKLPEVFNERRHEESNVVIRGNSTLSCISKGRDEFGTSPIEIARAYMDSRASEAGPSSKNMIQTVESTMLRDDKAAIKSYDLSSKKSPTCWPGAVVQDAYTTPQSQGSKYGLINNARTPYSRTLLMKSKSKLIHTQGNYSHISSTPLCQSQTSRYLKDKSDGGALESGYGSVGPIRRTRHKVAVQSTPHRPAYLSMNPSHRQNSSFIEYSSPTVATSMDPGRMSSTHDKPMGFERSVPTVHMHTSLMAKKILEHIDRSVPTPKEKSAELKLATKWKNPESSVNTIFSNEDNGLVKLKDVSPCKYDEFGVMNSTLKNKDEGNCNVDIQPRESTDKSSDVTKEGTLASDLSVHNSIPRLANDARTTQSFGSSQMFSMKSTYKDGLMAIPSGGRPSLVNQEKKTVANNNGASKPVLAPISIKKPESKWTIASDSTTGFTFPVTTASSVFSELPTPSVMPLLLSNGNQHKPEKISTELSYNFGVKKSNPAVVFSFPSTSNTVHNDAGVINYNFGSTDMTRLSFSFGKPAINC